MPSKLTLTTYFCFLFSCTHMTHTPPDANPKDKELSIHGDTRLDTYYWLNDREDPEVIQYLEMKTVTPGLYLNPLKRCKSSFLRK